MRRGILSLSLPGMRRSSTARKPNNVTRAEQQSITAPPPPEPAPIEMEAPEVPAIEEEEVIPYKPKGPSMMKAILKRHDEISARVHKAQEQAQTTGQ